MNDEKNKIISRIIQLESIVTEAYFKGHKAHIGDEYQILRDELKVLRQKLSVNTETEKIYQVKLKHNLHNIVLGEKITVPRGEIILDNLTESKLKFIEYPLVARDHGNGIKTMAYETDCNLILK